MLCGVVWCNIDAVSCGADAMLCSVAWKDFVVS